MKQSIRIRDNRRSARLQSRNNTKTNIQKPIEFSLFFFSANSVDSSRKSSDIYRLELEAAALADTLQFKAIWTPERHFEEFGGSYPNPSILSTAIAAKTRNLKIRAGSVIATIHNPISIVEDWSMVDQLSNGRVQLAFAKGWHKNDFIFNHAAFDNIEEEYWDRLSLIDRLWKGSQVTLPGVHGAGQKVLTFPRPVQKGLDMWVTTSGREESWRQAGLKGYNILAAIPSDHNTLSKNISIYKSARESVGLTIDGGQISIMIHTFVHPNESQALAMVEAPLKRYIRTFMKQKQSAASESIPSSDAKQSFDELVEHSFQEFISKRSLIGDESSVINKIKNLTDMGVTDIACLVNFGLHDSDILASIEQLGGIIREVESDKQGEVSL